MRRLRAWLLRFFGMFRTARRDRDLAAEIESHLQLHIDDNLRAGMSAAEARRQALLKLGGVDPTLEAMRDRVGLPAVETVLEDVRYGWRMLRRTPTFTAVAVATLALGIGANAAIFSVVNAVLLRPMPFPDPGRLFLVWATDTTGGNDHDVASYPDFADWRAQSRSFENLAALAGGNLVLSGGESAVYVRGARVSPGFFELLGVRPARGRSILLEDEKPGAPRVVVLSDSLWKRQFGSRADILGASLRVNEASFTVVGVLPPGFELSPGEPPEIYAALAPDDSRGHGFLMVLGRLRTGVSQSTADAELQVIAAGLRTRYPATNRNVGVRVEPLVSGLAGPAGTGLWVLLGVVGIVLLVACTNVANLTLARGASRQRELSVRAALGAGRRRLLRQLLTESTLLALGGGALGLLVANWVARALVGVLSRNFTIPRLADTHTDGAVLGFALLLSIGTGLLFGVVPALSAASGDLHAGLRESGRSASEGKRGGRIRGFLVIAETALALVLLTGAGLLLKALLVMQGTNPGFQPEKLLAVELRLPQQKYAKSAARADFSTRLLDATRALPGIRSVALVADVPLGGGQDSLGFHIVGRPDPSPGKFYSAGFNVVSEGYFTTMGIPVRRGREFTARDAADAPGVIVINETAARRFWPGEDAIGRQIVLPDAGDTTVTLTVIGVTGDVRHVGLAQAPRPEMFVNVRQSGLDWPFMVLVSRTDGDPGSAAAMVKDAASRVDPDVPIVEVRTMDEILSRSLAAPRVSALLIGTFALLALLLAAVGLYGVVSYTASQRTHEMGIRLALGARRGDITRLVLRQGLSLALAGSVIGLAGSVAVTRVLGKLVIGVQPDDPLTFALVTALLLAVALAASYLPARRAASADPLSALRSE